MKVQPTFPSGRDLPRCPVARKIINATPPCDILFFNLHLFVYTTTRLLSYLAGYVLTIEVMTVERGLKSWKSVQGCSVESEESETQPEALAETIAMTQASDA